MFAESGPYVRTLLRFSLLPLCFMTKVDWEECTKPRLHVAADLLYIFFALRYYPDNYGPCRLWEKPRGDWKYYYGSSYNPWARHFLRRSVQPFRHIEGFVDKIRCEEHFRSHGIPMPRPLGVVNPGDDLALRLATLIASNGGNDIIVKPIRGARGRGVYIATTRQDRVALRNGSGFHDPRALKLNEAYLAEDLIKQHGSITRIFPHAVNTIRVVTLLTAGGEALLIGSYMRFGTDSSIVDNVNRGGVAVGVDPGKGCLLREGYDAKGRRHAKHPDTGFVFEGCEVPWWREVEDVARRAQLASPFYKLIGLDVAVTENGPTVLEVNANPDIVGLEQKCGPLLKDRRTLIEFDRHQLLFNRRQADLAAELARAADE